MQQSRCKCAFRDNTDQERLLKFSNKDFQMKNKYSLKLFVNQTKSYMNISL